MTPAPALATTYRCDRCDRYFAESALEKIAAGGGYVLACPTCGDLARREVSREARSLPALLAGAFAYPFRGATIMWVVALLVGMTFLQLIPFVGGLLATSAELGLLFGVLRSTAAGHAELRVETSDLADTSLWFGPLLRYLAAVLVSFGPAIAAGVLLQGNSSLLPIAYAVAGLGLLYFPASLVVAAHSDGCLGVLNPAAGIAFITRIPGPYFITLAFVAIAAGVGAGMMAGAATIELPIVSIVVRSVASLYGPLVAMRMLGLLIEEHAEEL